RGEVDAGLRAHVSACSDRRRSRRPAAGTGQRIERRDSLRYLEVFETGSGQPVYPVLRGDAPGMTFLLPCPHARASAVRLAVNHSRTVISGCKSVHEQRVAGAAMFSGEYVASHAGLAPVAYAVLADEVEVNVILGLRQHGARQ